MYSRDLNCLESIPVLLLGKPVNPITSIKGNTCTRLFPVQQTAHTPKLQDYHRSTSNGHQYRTPNGPYRTNLHTVTQYRASYHAATPRKTPPATETRNNQPNFSRLGRAGGTRVDSNSWPTPRKFRGGRRLAIHSVKYTNNI